MKAEADEKGAKQTTKAAVGSILPGRRVPGNYRTFKVRRALLYIEPLLFSYLPLSSYCEMMRRLACRFLIVGGKGCSFQ